MLANISALSVASTSKIDRKLYVGNLPPSITQRELIDKINEAMLIVDQEKKWGLQEKSPGNPVVSSWISSDGHYGFIEFRNAYEASLGFDLQGMSIKGTTLRIGRPKAY